MCRHKHARARAHRHTRQSRPQLCFPFQKGGRGGRQPGTSGVTFCPRLLGAPARSSADVRHQAGCRAGREHSLTFVEVVLARKGFFPSLLLSCPGLSTQARQLCGEACLGVHGGEWGQPRRVLLSGQGFMNSSKAPKAQRGEDGSPRTHSRLATRFDSNQGVQHPGQGSSGLKPAAGFFTRAGRGVLLLHSARQVGSEQVGLGWEQLRAGSWGAPPPL